MTNTDRDWQEPPTEHVGNVHWRAVATQMNLAQLLSWADAWASARYSPRLDGEKTWELLHNGVEGLRVLDYGCGLGVEALLFARAGNLVSIADIHAGNLVAASRVMLADGFMPDSRILIANARQPLPAHDVFFASGVLHHMPMVQAQDVLTRAAMAGAKEARLLLYTDDAWTWATGTRPDRQRIEAHEKFDVFVRKMDAVGSYAEWYDELRIAHLLPVRWTIDCFERITDNNRFAVVRMVAP